MRLELEQLFLGKQGLGQFAFIQFILWFSSQGQARLLFADSPDYWSSYILTRGFCLALLLNAVVALELFVKPKMARTLEMLLVTGLSPRAIASTNVAAAAVYNAVSLLVYFLVLAASIARFDFAWLHLLSFGVLLLADIAALILTGFFAMQTKHGSRLSAGLILLSVMLLFATGFYQYNGAISPAFQLALGGALALAAAASTLVFRLFDKEKMLRL